MRLWFNNSEVNEEMDNIDLSKLADEKWFDNEIKQNDKVKEVEKHE